jgi:hypothetical protein
MTSKPIPRRLAAQFRRAVKDRGDALKTVAREHFGVTRQHLHEVLVGRRTSAPLVEKITAYVEAA